MYILSFTSFLHSNFAAFITYRLYLLVIIVKYDKTSFVDPSRLLLQFSQGSYLLSKCHYKILCVQVIFKKALVQAAGFIEQLSDFN